jgi:hypothetical protein
MTAAAPQAQPRVNPLSADELFQIERMLIRLRFALASRTSLPPSAAESQAIDHVQALINRLHEVRSAQ